MLLLFVLRLRRIGRFAGLRLSQHYHSDLDEGTAGLGIGNYGGGQFELGVGRGQNQYLASLFHADAPNDVAPTGFNLPDPPPDLPSSPLAPAAAELGFRWG